MFLARGNFVDSIDSRYDWRGHGGNVQQYDVTDAQVTWYAGVRAKVLSIDAEKQRLSMGLKPSYFSDDEGDPEQGEEEEGTPGDMDDDMDAEVLEALEESSDEEEDWRAGAEILTGDISGHSFCSANQCLSI